MLARKTAIPLSAAIALAALEVVEREPQLRKRLWENTAYFKEGLESLGFNMGMSETPICPILIGDNALTMEANHRLMARGVFVQGIRPPTVPPQGSRLRAALMATHTEKDLKSALDALQTVGEELGLIGEER